MEQHWTRNCEARTWSIIRKQWNKFWIFLLKQANLTTWLGESSSIISFQSKLNPAINQTAYCHFWKMGAKITWNFVKCVSWKKQRRLLTRKRITVPQFLQKSRKALTDNKLDSTKSSLKRLGKAQKKIDNARSRGSPLREILQYDLTRDCP